MKTKTFAILTSLCTLTLLTSACTTCPMKPHDGYQHQEQHRKDKSHQKHDKKKHGDTPVVFQQNYDASDITKVKANMSTRNSKGSTSEMGTIWFKETPDGLKMIVDLVYLRPNKTYTAEIYQCGACNDNTCCSMEAMSVDLPQLKVSNNDEQLKQSYIVRGLTASQLNNAKIILTRDKGHKAAWGTLKQ